MEPILAQLKKIIGDNEVLKTILAGAAILALLSLIILQIPLFLIFVFVSVVSFLQLQKKKSS